MSTVRGMRLARARRELIRHLKHLGALTDASAQPIEPANSLEATMLKRMLKREVIRPGSKGGYWLDEERYAEWRRQQVLVAFGIALVMGGIVACLSINEPTPHARHAAAAADSAAVADSLSSGPRAGGAPPP